MTTKETTETETAQTPAVHEPSEAIAKIPASRVPMGMLPATLEEGMKLANLLAKSTLVPKDFQNQPANVFIAIQWGSELGLAPMQAMQSIAVINGRPTMWGDGMLALIMGSPHFEWIDEPPVTGEVATCSVKRRGSPHPVVRTFSMKDAKAAGLTGKQGPWQSYPSRMLQMRARGFALRDAFPDVLRGIITAEEAIDLEPRETINVTPSRAGADPSPASPPPEGFDAFVAALKIAAAEGTKNFNAFWKESKLDLRGYLTSTDPALWNAVKQAAVDADAANAGELPIEQATA